MFRTLRILLPASVALFFLVAGCTKPENKFVGDYVGKQQLTKTAMDQINKLPKAAAEAMKKQIDASRVNLTLNKDKTAQMSVSGQGVKTQGISGTWAYSNDKVDVTLGGGTPMELTPSSDGKTLTLSGSQYGSLTFTKS
jgi:hypothetical protein